MTKKVFIVLAVLFTTLFLGSSVFAASDIENGARDVGTEVKDSWDKLGNTAENLGNNVKGAVDTMGDKAKDMMDMNNDNNNNNGWFDDNRNNNDGYQATRTSATSDNAGLFGMNSTAWTWFIIAVLAIAIGGLVWYYGSQIGNNNNSRR